MSRSVAQLHLSDNYPQGSRSKELMSVVDKINYTGLGKIWFAGQGIALGGR
ncbi:TPA: hypothetical protein U5E43_004024 [Yersinia enterocolitica]|nr:hypothetical protein [Yersinia enterocolitica]HEN3647866.1 hypothetical protein [Yersinia enterocolitica]